MICFYNLEPYQFSQIVLAFFDKIRKQDYKIIRQGCKISIVLLPNHYFIWIFYIFIYRNILHSALHKSWYNFTLIAYCVLIFFVQCDIYWPSQRSILWFWCTRDLGPGDPDPASAGKSDQDPILKDLYLNLWRHLRPFSNVIWYK